jgi:hypothetical protein
MKQLALCIPMPFAVLTSCSSPLSATDRVRVGIPGNYIDLTVRRQGAPVVHKSGYTLTIMRKQPDGRWVLARDANLLAAKE